jgi:hypothetical protein
MNDRGETGMITEGGYLTALRRFHERNWREDAGDLDGSLARRAQGTAGLAATPPSIITGDPFSLEADSCVLVLGINPRWPGSRLQKLDAEQKLGRKGLTIIASTGVDISTRLRDPLGAQRMQTRGTMVPTFRALGTLLLERWHVLMQIGSRAQLQGNSSAARVQS